MTGLKPSKEYVLEHVRHISSLGLCNYHTDLSKHNTLLEDSRYFVLDHTSIDSSLVWPEYGHLNCAASTLITIWFYGGCRSSDLTCSD